MLKVTYLSILLLLFFNEMWIRAVQPLLLIDGRDFFLFFSSSCDAKHQSGARQPNRSQWPQQDATPHSVNCNFNRCLRSQGGMPRGWGCQRASFPWGHQQRGQPPMSAPAVTVHEQTLPFYLQLCCCTLIFSTLCQSSSGLSLFFLTWQCRKSWETLSQASKPPWLLHTARSFIVPLHRWKWGRCRDLKSMFCVWPKPFPPASGSVTSNAQKCISL